MKKPNIPEYQQDFPINNGANSLPVDQRTRSTSPYYTPTLQENVPPVGEDIYLVYDNDGKYMGWSDIKTGKKYFYGLYYPTKNSYKAYTSKPTIYRTSRTNHTAVYVRERSTNKTAIVFVERNLEKTDIINPNNAREQAEVTLDTLKGIISSGKVSPYVLKNISDPYNLLSKVSPPIFRTAEAKNDVLRKEIEKVQKQAEQDEANLEAKIQTNNILIVKQLADHVQSIIDGEDATAAGSKESGINLNI